MRRVAPSALLVLSLACGLAGCSSDPSRGYAFQSGAPRGVSTVAVPMFRNNTMTPGIEQPLTEAIIKQIQAATPMRVVQSGRAQSTLTGVITDAQMRRVSVESTTGLVQELALQVTVDFEWRDARDADVLVAKKNFSSADTFVPARPTGERFEIGRQATLERLAREIVSQLRSAW